MQRSCGYGEKTAFGAHLMAFYPDQLDAMQPAKPADALHVAASGEPVCDVKFTLIVRDTNSKK